MSVLLDTHIWIWWLTGQQELTAAERAALEAAAAKAPPYIAAISLWEAQLLHARQRLALQIPFAEWLVQATMPDVVRIAPLTPAVVVALDGLPASFHGDPADRLIVATARALGVPLFTRDQRINRAQLTKPWPSATSR